MAYCDRCDRHFPYLRALQQHKENSSHHNWCYKCDIDFSSWLGLKEHWVQSPRHAYCQYCDTHYDDDEEYDDHLHQDHAYCDSCSKVFKNDRGLHEHNRQVHFYCVDCKRVFMSASNLAHHRNSSIHRPKDIRCPFLGCALSFVSRSAMILHLESGGCRSRVDRAIINRFVLEHDRNNIITDPARMIAGPNGSAASNTTTYHATRAAWNGTAYECYLCHNTFRALVSLDQHLASPRHQDKIYVCPLTSCREHFTALSGLCQHIESERCGVSKFAVVQTTMDSVVGRMGLLAF